jgi:HlyD family secretion protein
MKKKVWVIGGGSFVVLAVAVFLLFFRGNTKKYEFRFDKVAEGDITVYVTATGTINAVTSVDVGTQVSGIIAKLYADFNSVVKEGQVIAQIDPTFLQQSVKDAEANLDRAKAQYEDSKRVRDRTTALFEKGLESQVNNDAALTNFESSQAALKQGQATLDRAKINLAYATIYAPINGVVIDRKVNVGQTVAASFSSPTLFTIANDLSKMQVQTTVDESDIGRISIGQEASFTVDAYPDEKFSGQVSQIRLAPVSVQNVVNYTVIIDVNNDQLKLMPGMTANVRVLVASTRNVLKVSNMALRFQAPSDLVDSTQINEMRASFMSRGKTDSSDTHPASAVTPGMEHTGGSDPAVAHQWPREGRGGEAVSSEGREGRRKEFQALRDSIQAAHGGQLSREEMMQEMQKAFAARQSTEKPAPAVKKPSHPGTGTKFGVTQTFPEYQKSSYVASHETGRGRIWILNSKGKLEPVFVRTGITDGKFTEITTSVLKAGDQIVLGASSNQEAAVSQGSNPLAGSGQRPMGGGPGR